MQLEMPGAQISPLANYRGSPSPWNQATYGRTGPSSLTPSLVGGFVGRAGHHNRYNTGTLALGASPQALAPPDPLANIDPRALQHALRRPVFPAPAYSRQDLANALVPRYGYGYAAHPSSHQCDCDDCNTGNYRNHKSHHCSRSGSSERSHSHERHRFKTKDIAIRGKSYKVRQSFLDDNSKFESDLVKFIDKKSAKEVPDGVVQMLVNIINDDKSRPLSMLDLVTLNIVASNLGIQSAVTTSLAEIKKHENQLENGEFAKIVTTIFLSSKVDSRLKAWLKEAVKKGGVDILNASDYFWARVDDHPEIRNELELLMGWRKAPDDDEVRTI